MILQQIIKLLTLTLIWWSSINVECAVAGTRDTRVINSGCSTINASNPGSFFGNVNETISELRGEIRNQSLHFGTSLKSKGDVNTYTMFQCRNYLSRNDCLACINTASTQIRDICKKSQRRKTHLQWLLPQVWEWEVLPTDQRNRWWGNMWEQEHKCHRF